MKVVFGFTSALLRHLPACALLVLAASAPSQAGTAALAWDAPTTYVDGSPLATLSGFKVYYGTAPDTYTGAVAVGNVRTYQFPNLPDGRTYYFAVTAVDAAGNESGYSNAVSKTLPPAQFSLSVSRTGYGSGVVSSTPAGISCGSACTGTYVSGTAVALSAVPAAGSTFAGWSGSCSGSAACTVTMDRDRTVSAAFAPATYRITAGAGTGGSLSPTGTVTVTYGGSQTFAISPSAGYHVADVLVDNASAGPVTSYTFRNVTAPHSITARFEINTYTITASASGAGGTILPAGSVTATHGGTAYFAITPDTGYHVADVKVDGVSVGPATSYTLTSIDRNRTITAGFALNSYTITASAGPGGSISPKGTLSALYGTNGTFTITPAANYRIADVRVDGIPAGTIDTYTFSRIAADHTIAASFEPRLFSLSVAQVGSGSGTVASSPAGISCGSSCVGAYVSGTTVTLTASPDAASVFKGWSGACSGLGACTIALSADTAVFAMFSPTPEFSIGCSDAGLPCVERPDGGNDGDNLTNGKPMGGVDYEFQVLVKDTGGVPPSIRLHLAQRTDPRPEEYAAYAMTCSGNFGDGARCIFRTKLGPAAAHRYYFEAVMSDGATVMRHPLTSSFAGPAVRLLTGYNLVGAPRDLSTAALDGTLAFGSSGTYQWRPDLGYYTKVTTTAPAKTGEGYYSYNKSGTLPELAGNADMQLPEFGHPVKSGWNIISNPFIGNVRLADVRVQRGSEAPLSWHEAVALGWVENALYSYLGSDWGAVYRPESGDTAVLVPWVGYRVSLKRSDAAYRLVIPRP